jgi:hypothetical protein
MSTYDRLVHRHLFALRVEKAFVIAVGIIAGAMLQVMI